MSVIDQSTDFGKRLRQQLDDEQVIWLTVVSANGTPLPTPVWFLLEDEDHLLIYSQPNTQKLKAISAHPRAALNFNSDEHGNKVGIIWGTATVVEDALTASKSPAYVAKYAGGLQSLNMTAEQFEAEYSVAIRITIEKVRGW